MVDPIAVSSDVVQTVVAIALVPALWLFLLLFIWENPELARPAGFSRLVFWLLLPAAMFGILADLPFFTYRGFVLAVNLGGGLLPVLFALLLLPRALGPGSRPTVRFVGTFAAESIVLFGMVAFLPANLLFDLLLIAVAVVATAFPTIETLHATDGPDRAEWLRVTLAVGITSGATIGTFFSTVSIPGTGIASFFPFYLLIPLAVGILAVPLFARARGSLAEPGALALAYAGAMFGVLIGADLLRQPPLYTHGPVGLYAIGGAGIFDLVYQTGLIALFAALLAYYALGRPIPPKVPSEERTPMGKLREALVAGMRGGIPESIARSAEAGRAAARQSRKLLGAPPPLEPSEVWEGLPIANWLATDQRNLNRLSLLAPTDPREAIRAYSTARWLVWTGEELGRRVFASASARAFAFLIDLAMVTVPAIAAWIAIALFVPGSNVQVLDAPVFAAASLGYAAWVYVYFVVLEGRFGTTIGKHAFHLAVRDRALQPPGLLAVLVREAPKLVPLSIIGVGGSLATYLLIRGAGVPLDVAGQGILPAALLSAFFVVVGIVAVTVGLCGLVGWALILVTSESQRFGDLIAGTWVVRTATVEAALPPPGAAGSVVPSG